jgi:hypothetical protein
MTAETPDKSADGETLRTHSDTTTVDTSGPNQNTPPPAPPLSMRAMKKMDKQRKMLMKLIKASRASQLKKQGALTRQLGVLRKAVGDSNFEAIKAIATTFYPEKKDDKGNVTQEAYNSVNYKALMAEARHLIVMQREKRIREGTRRRSSGRSSDRKAHSLTYRYLIDRGNKAVENKEAVSTVKV